MALFDKAQITKHFFPKLKASQSAWFFGLRFLRMMSKRASQNAVIAQPIFRRMAFSVSSFLLLPLARSWFGRVGFTSGAITEPWVSAITEPWVSWLGLVSCLVSSLSSSSSVPP